MDDPAQEHGKRWLIGIALGAAFTLFALWWLFLSVGFGLGLCGEDGELSAADYRRACGGDGGDGGDGQLYDALLWIGVGATAVAAVVGAFALRERSWTTASGAALWLLGMAVLLGNVRSIVGV